MTSFQIGLLAGGIVIVSKIMSNWMGMPMSLAEGMILHFVGIIALGSLNEQENGG